MDDDDNRRFPAHDTLVPAHAKARARREVILPISHAGERHARRAGLLYRPETIDEALRDILGLPYRPLRSKGRAATHLGPDRTPAEGAECRSASRSAKSAPRS